MDPATLKLNMAIIVTVLVLLLIGGILLVALWTGLSAWIAHVRRRRAYELYLRASRAPDGRMYPPCGGGICEKCGRISRQVYYLRTGETWCRSCYDQSCLTAVAESAANARKVTREPV